MSATEPGDGGAQAVRAVSRVGAGALALAALVLGWGLDWGPARSWLADWPTMKPLTALQIVGLVLALAPGSRAPGGPRATRGALAAALATACLAGLLLGASLAGREPSSPWLGLPTLATSAALLLLALAATGLGLGPRRPAIVVVLALVSLGLATQRLLVLTVIGPGPGHGIFASMAFPTAVCVLLLAVCTLLDPRLPVAGLLTAPTRVGGAARRGAAGIALGVTLSVVVTVVVASAGLRRAAVPLEEVLAVSTMALLLGLTALLAALLRTLQQSEALAERKRLLRAITDHVPGMVGFWDRDLVCRFANPAYLHWFGRRPEEVVGQRMIDLLGEATYRKNEPYIRGALAGEPQRFERSLVKPSGELGHTWAQYIPDRVGGEVRGFTVLVTDVTLLRERELELQAHREQLEVIVAARTAALRESEERFRQLTHSLPQLVWTCTPDGDCEFLSDQWVHYTGIGPEAQLGAGWRGAMHPDDREAFVRLWRDTVALGEPLTIELRLRRHDGAYRWFDTRAVAMRDATGAVSKCFGTSTDIEDRMALELALRRHTAELERSNAALEQFAWVASHDLQEPLRMVGSFSQLLARRYTDQLDDRGRVMLGQVTDGARRMQALVDSLLTYARIGGRKTTGLGVDMSAAARRALELLAESARSVGAEVDIAAAMPWAPIDEAEATQLWQNLLGNAIKHRGDASPQVRAGVRAGANGEPVYFVADTGPGIAARHQERVFQIFQRLEADPRRRHEGIGMGLALCRRIVESAAGRIWIESDGSTGTTVYFTLPASQGAPA